jgi:hypothetical protein
MEYFVGLDVPIDETTICVVDDKGTVTFCCWRPANEPWLFRWKSAVSLSPSTRKTRKRQDGMSDLTHLRCLTIRSN